jgi:hypothetical protein
MNSDIPEFEATVDEQGRVAFCHPGQARAYLRGKFAGQYVAVQVYEQRAKRSDRQNRGFHAMITPWAIAEGKRIDDLKRELLEFTFSTFEATSSVTGEVYQVLAEPHTSKLSVGQFCQLIDATLELAAEHGHMLIAPDEYRKAKEAERKKAARAARREAA